MGNEINLRATAMAHAMDLLRHSKKEFDSYDVTGQAQVLLDFLRNDTTKPSTTDDIPF
jgi:hypothetical protein